MNNVLTLVALIFVMALFCSVASLLGRFFFKDEYCDYKTYNKLIDWIGENDVARDCIWSFCMMVSIALSVTILSHIQYPFAYTLAFITTSVTFASLQKSVMWATRNNNAFLESMNYFNSIFVVLVSYVLYLAMM